jgi:DNA-binding MarR family transcriptional regulator
MSDDPDVERLQTALRRVMRSLRHRRHGLPATLLEQMRVGRLGPRHVAALAAVAREEGLSVGDLAQRLGLTLASASLLVGELASAGVVERREDETDRRRTLVHVAAPARPSVEQWLAQRDEPLRSTLRRLEAEDRVAFLAGLEALADELEASAPPGPPPRRLHRRPHRRADDS